MSLPIVAVVGRPNVGKSTFVNRIAQSADAIVHEMRGVTRDRSYHKADWNGVEFLLVDTGGIALAESDRFQRSITSQALMACEEADCIVFLVDGRTGATTEDDDIAKVLKRTDTPVLLAVNKMDNPDSSDELWPFYAMGLGDPWPVSATHGHGTGDLLDELVARLPQLPREEEGPGCVDLAIIGRPNAGKSSLTNRLVGTQRCIVSDVAGTTRDAIDTFVEHGGTLYRIVDTAGIRRKSQIDDDVEYYGFVRSLRAIERAHVVLLMVDATLGLTDQDQRVARMARERGCAMAVLVNKWDAVTDATRRDDILSFLDDRMEFVSYAPVIPMSALTGQGVKRVWDAVETAYANYMRRIPTNQLNKLVTQLRDFGHGVSKGSKRLRVNYATQTAVAPPVFSFFANFPEIVDDNYERYLENRLRATFDLTGTPIRLKFKRKN